MNKHFATVVIAILLLGGCNLKEPIIDETTIYELPLMEQLDRTYLTHYVPYDGMYRSQQYAAGSTLVIDPHYYDNKEISRGDVVYYKRDEDSNLEFDVARIIAFPGEKMKIKKGQVYINGHMLDTFYGKEYFNKNFISGTSEGLNKKEITVPMEHYFVAGDVWWRAGFTTPPHKDMIRGKVIGWMKKSDN